MKFIGIIETFSTGLYDSHIMLPQDISEELINSPYKRRVVVSYNGGPVEHCALHPHAGNQWYLILRKKLLKSHGFFEQDEIEVEINSDTSEYGMPVPEEFAEMLEADPEGSDLFHQLTPGKQRTLMYMVTRVKATRLRERRSYVILQHLRGYPKVDYKALNQEMKEANQKNL
ncbi:MAG: hypothetical protein SchgKO_24050 [Schleiferiaceae bacterium]